MKCSEKISTKHVVFIINYFYLSKLPTYDNNLYGKKFKLRFGLCSKKLHISKYIYVHKKIQPIYKIKYICIGITFVTYLFVEIKSCICRKFNLNVKINNNATCKFRVSRWRNKHSDDPCRNYGNVVSAAWDDRPTHTWNTIR